MYTHVSAAFSDGKRVVFDNVITDNNGRILLINETKSGGSFLSDNQKRFFIGGESVTFVGENASKARLKGKKINLSDVNVRHTRVKFHE